MAMEDGRSKRDKSQVMDAYFTYVGASGVDIFKPKMQGFVNQNQACRMGGTGGDAVGRNQRGGHGCFHKYHVRFIPLWFENIPAGGIKTMLQAGAEGPG